MLMLVLAHEVAGRLRFVSPVLKGDGRQAGQLERQVRAVPGVTDVQVRRNTGQPDWCCTTAHMPHAWPSCDRWGLPRPCRKRVGQRLLDELVEAAAQHLLNLAARGVIAALL